MLFAVLPLVARIAGSRLEKRPVTTSSAVPSDQKAPQTGVGMLDILYEPKLTEKGCKGLNAYQFCENPA